MLAILEKLSFDAVSDAGFTQKGNLLTTGSWKGLKRSMNISRLFLTAQTIT